MTYNAYPKYKDSGVEWLGRVPEHWNTDRAKCLFTIKKRIAGTEGFDVLSITQQGIKVKDIESGDGQLAMDYSKYQFVEVGDFAMNHMDLLTGYVDISSVYGVTSPDYRVFSINKKEAHLDRYFLYLFQMGYKEKIFYAFGQGASQLGRWRLPTEQFNDLRFPIPSIGEQKSIVAFLDAQTEKIDQAIGKQEQLIVLLQEKRQAMISQVVTKGLDPSVPMKDSGIDWLGKIPAHWEKITLKYVVSMQSGEQITADSIEEEGAYPVFGGNGLRGYTDQYTHDGFFPLIGRQGALCGNINYAEGKFWASEHAVVVSPKGKYDVFWLGELLHAMNLGQYSVTAAQPGLSVEVIGNLRIPLPPIKEQTIIAAYLKKAISKIDAVADKARSVIDSLQERRSALISAAVTGKIDVRGIAGKIAQPQISEIQKSPANDNSMRSIAFAKVANELCVGREWGQVDQMKAFYLLEAHFGLADVIEEYDQAVAGPHSGAVMENNNNIGLQNEWFAIQKKGKSRLYSRDKKSSECNSLFDEKFSDSAELKSFINLLKGRADSEIEICATLHHCWMPYALKKIQVTDADLLKNFYKYSERKKMFLASKVREMLAWMKEKKITPFDRKPFQGYADEQISDYRQEKLFS